MVSSLWPHKLFERKNGDLHVEVPVPLTGAVLGGEVEVPTLMYRVKMDMMIWDLIGSKESTRLHEMYYRGADGAIVVADITRLSTIENLHMWVTSFRRAMGEKAVLMVYNKTDLEGYWTLDEHGMESLAARYDTIYYKTSAKTGDNVEIAFYRLAELMLEQDKKKREKAGPKL